MNSEIAYADVTSGVASDVTKIAVKGASNDDGDVVGATITTSIYSEASSDSITLNVLVQNQVVRTVGCVNGFYKIRYGKSYGYVKAVDCVTGDELAKYIVKHPEWFVKKAKVLNDDTPLYDWLSDTIYAAANPGDCFQIKDEDGDYYTVIYTEVSDTGDEINTLVRIVKRSVKLVHSLHVTSFSSYGTTTQEQMDLIEYACSFVGNAYVWGGVDPNTGADCSGFVQYVFNNFGITLPRCSFEQATIGEDVSFEDMMPGDLVFYKRGDRIGHVAIYIGDGQVVQARGSAYGICITKYDYSTPAFARRVL